MKAVIYARVSSQSDRQSTARQVEDLTVYAKGMGYDLMATYEEHISGAAKNKDKQALQDCISYAHDNSIGIILVSELSRLGRNAFEVLETIKRLIDLKINLYVQKEQFSLLDGDGKTTIFAPVMLATLATCAELERENIKHRLNSGREKYIREGGKLGRPSGTFLDDSHLLSKHRDIAKLLNKGYPQRKVATLTSKSLSTVQRVQKALKRIKGGDR